MKIRSFKYLFILTIFSASTGHASPLPVDEAFKVDAMIDEKRLYIRFNMPPGYYLYSEKLSLKGEGGSKQLVYHTAGELVDDEWLGESYVFRNQTVISTSHTSTKYTLHFQGCAENLLCYLPQTKELNF